MILWGFFRRILLIFFCISTFASSLLLLQDLNFCSFFYYSLLFLYLEFRFFASYSAEFGLLHFLLPRCSFLWNWPFVHSFLICNILTLVFWGFLQSSWSTSFFSEIPPLRNILLKCLLIIKMLMCFTIHFISLDSLNSWN